MTDARRAIPSVERLLTSVPLQSVLATASRPRVVELLRAIQAEQRSLDNDVGLPDAAWYAAEVSERLERARQRSLRGVINASGVILHTNIGRAPLSLAAIEAMTAVAGDYSTLEYDVSTGSRGSRYDHCADLLCSLTGAESALVVNNNAAALSLVFNTFALGRPVVVSRGELVEIGESFRIAEIVERSGAQVREVGSTNRTHLSDYEGAVDGAAAILKVHPSNFQARGFVSAVDAVELAPLARSAGVPLVHDLGSGLIEPLDDVGLPHEPTVAQALRAGADLVTMSGDKLLGGPQAGILLGRHALIATLKRNPLCRALRVDKLTLSALEATLLSYENGTARSDVPVLRMICASANELRERAGRVVSEVATAALTATVADGVSRVGGGAFPDAALPTSLVALAHESLSASRLEFLLRTGEPPVICRLADDRVMLDLRTVMPEHEDILVRRIRDVA